MTILVDTQHRTGHSGDLAPTLRQLVTPRSLIEETYLEYGDVAFAGNGPAGRAVRVGIEIKRISDVLRCIEDGRFAGEGGQLEGLHRDYDVCWLLIEEDLRPDPSTGVLMRRLQGVRRAARKGRAVGAAGARARAGGSQAEAGRWVPALFGAKRTMMYGDLAKWMTSVQVVSTVKYGKPLFVWRTSSQMETARWVTAQYEFWCKQFEHHKSMHSFNRSGWEQGQAAGRRKPIGFTSKHRRFRATTAACADGLGFDKAMNLANRFRSVHEMVSADVEQLITPASQLPDGKRAGNGIGRKVAEKLWAQWREKGK